MDGFFVLFVFLQQCWFQSISNLKECGEHPKVLHPSAIFVFGEHEIEKLSYVSWLHPIPEFLQQNT